MQSPESRVQSAECRVQSAECRVQSPESRVQSPESRVQSPESRVQSPESRVQSPESRVQSPESRVQSPVQSPVQLLAYAVIFKGILCGLEEGAKIIVNTSHALQTISYYCLTSTYLCLRVCPFASIHLLVFGCLFLVGQRLGGWVLSERLANKSAWSSSSEVLLHVFSDVINLRVFRVKIHFEI